MGAPATQWSERELELIETYYEQHGPQGLVDKGLISKKSLSAIAIQASRMGLVYEESSRTRWTEAELKRLRNCYPVMGPTDLCESGVLRGRSLAAIKAKAYAEGLTYEPDNRPDEPHVYARLRPTSAQQFKVVAIHDDLYTTTGLDFGEVIVRLEMPVQAGHVLQWVVSDQDWVDISMLARIEDLEPGERFSVRESQRNGLPDECVGCLMIRTGEGLGADAELVNAVVLEGPLAGKLVSVSSETRVCLEMSEPPPPIATND